MILWALGERGQWARQLQQAGQARGLDVWLFTVESPPPLSEPGIAFFRLDPEQEALRSQRALLWRMVARGWSVVPDTVTAEVYEDKLAQARRYWQWMPSTVVLTDRQVAQQHLALLGYPFVSKSRTGAGSANVRLIADAAAAQREIDEAFGSGIAVVCDWGEPRQQGYLIWQEFLTDNAGDYRVIVVGRYRMVLWRHNRSEVPFASGSGSSTPVTEITATVAEVLAQADAFFHNDGLTWCGVDMVRDGAGRWKILETTCAWTLPGYAECVFFDQENQPTAWRGRDIWDVLLSEIEAGAMH